MRARKRFGQNFLNDPSVIDAIVAFISPKPDDVLIEIGPGRGALTKALLPNVKVLHAIELDRDLIHLLQTAFSKFDHFFLYEADALRFDYSQWEGPVRVVGNLPYNISTPLLFHLFEYGRVIKDITVMLQKEVVDRLQASPGTKAYGRLSVMAQYHCEVRSGFEVYPESFTPKPKVDSAVVRLSPRPPKLVANDYLRFSEIVNAAFCMRRKQIKNSLSKYATENALQTLNIDPMKRPEELTLDEYVTLSNSV